MKFDSIIVIKNKTRLFRVLHDFETYRVRDVYPDKRADYDRYGWLWRAGGKGGVPEVFNFINGHMTKFTEQWQYVSYELNPGMDKMKWRNLYDDRRAFTNDSGFSHWDRTDPRFTPRRDYVNKIDTDAKEFPYFDNTRVCGGATLAGKVVGDYLEVETMMSLKTVDYIRSHPWLYFVAVNVAATSTAQREVVSDFPQGDGRPVLIPLISTTKVKYPMAWLEEVSEIANPYEVK